MPEQKHNKIQIWVQGMEIKLPGNVNIQVPFNVQIYD